MSRSPSAARRTIPSTALRTGLGGLLAAALLTLGACADMDHHGGGMPKSDVTRVSVSVKEGQIQVDPFIVIVSGGAPAVVEWSLPPGSQLRFPKYGVFIEGEVDFPKNTVVESRGGDAAAAAVGRSVRGVVSLPIKHDNTSDFSCELLDNATRVVCKSAKQTPGVYKTTVRVLDGETVLKLDPPMIWR